MNRFTRRSEVHDTNTLYHKDLNVPICRLKAGQLFLPIEGLPAGTDFPKIFKK